MPLPDTRIFNPLVSASRFFGLIAVLQLAVQALLLGLQPRTERCHRSGLDAATAGRRLGGRLRLSASRWRGRDAPSPRPGRAPRLTPSPAGPSPARSEASTGLRASAARSEASTAGRTSPPAREHLFP